MKHQIFLSYSFQDKAWVSAFVHALKEKEVNVWFDVEEIAIGEKIRESIEKTLRESSVMVVILSANSVRSPWIFFELGAAIADNKRIIPVVIDDIAHERLPLPITRYQYLREKSPLEAGKKVAKALET